MMMTEQQTRELRELIERARKFAMSEPEQAEQRRSFAFGNAAFENPRITREMVAEEDRKLAAE